MDNWEKAQGATRLLAWFFAQWRGNGGQPITISVLHLAAQIQRTSKSVTMAVERLQRSGLLTVSRVDDDPKKSRIFSAPVFGDGSEDWTLPALSEKDKPSKKPTAKDHILVWLKEQWAGNGGMPVFASIHDIAQTMGISDVTCRTAVYKLRDAGELIHEKHLTGDGLRYGKSSFSPPHK